MSENTGFRVTVFLNLFFKDHKSRSSVYVNTNLFRTVQAFKNHISHLFHVPHDDFDLHCDNNFLPPEEDIRVLKPDDTVHIIPNKWDYKTHQKQTITVLEQDNSPVIDCSLNDSNEQSQEAVLKTKLKRKRSINANDINKDKQILQVDEVELRNIIDHKAESRKKRKDSLDIITQVNNKKCEQSRNKKVKTHDIKRDSNSDYPDIDTPPNGYSASEKINFYEHLTHSTESNLEKAKDSMRSCSLPKCNSFNNGEIQFVNNNEPTVESPLKDTPTFVTIKRPRVSTPYIQPIGTLLRELKNSSAKTNCSYDTINDDTKKRKRYRKRKRPTKFDQISAIDEKPSQIEDVINIKTQRTHIKFSDNVEIIPSVPAVLNSFSLGGADNGNSTDSAIEVVDVASSADSRDVTHAPIMTIASIQTSPSMKNITPKAGDLIAFKMLKLSDSYTPELSKYITAKTVYYDLMSKSISMQIIEGGEEMVIPNGKFSMDILDVLEAEGQLKEEITVDWNKLIDPRLLYP